MKTQTQFKNASLVSVVNGSIVVKDSTGREHTFKKAVIRTINNGHIELESEGKTYSMDNCSVESIVDGDITIKYNCPFKDGDYVNVWDLIHGNYVTCIFKSFDGDLHHYISEPFHGDKLKYNDVWMTCYFWLNDIFPATPADIERLNSKLMQEGKVWNPETKQAEKYRWKPKDGEYYFTIATSMGNLEIRHYMWTNDLLDKTLYKIGNCYKTKAEAETKLEQIKKLLLEV